MEVKKPKENLTVNISTTTVIKVLIVLLLLGFLFLIKGVLAIVFVSIILASAFDSWVDWFQKKKLPRSIGILLIFILAFGILSIVVVLMINPLQEQWNELVSNPPEQIGWFYNNVQQLWQYADEQGFLNKIQEIISSDKIGSTVSGFFSKIGSAANGLMTMIFILVLTFYMVVEENAIKKVIWSVTPSTYQPYVMQLVNRIQKRIGTWLKAQLVLGLIVGVLTMVLLLIVRNKYYLVLGLIAGIFEIVPVIGPIFAGIVAVLLTLATYGWSKAILVLIIAIAVQQFENNVLVPRIMRKALGLNPIVTLVALLIGAKLAGFAGAILAIPATTAISAIVEDFVKDKEE